MAKFENHLSYKNRRNGVIAERLGYVQFHNFKIADNAVGGMEVSLTENINEGYAKITGALIVGQSENSEKFSETSPQFGIITPRSDNFSIENTSFFNFKQTNSAALGTCSHCFHGAATDSGARTVNVSGLKFTDVPKRIIYQEPYRAIFFDEDGSLTGASEQSWATPYWKHNDVEGPCKHKPDSHDGLICDNTV